MDTLLTVKLIKILNQANFKIEKKQIKRKKSKKKKKKPKKKADFL